MTLNLQVHLIEPQTSLLSLMKWSKENQLEFNIQEDETITITKSDMQYDYLNILCFVWANDIYSTKKRIRGLGVWVTPNL